MIQLPTGFAPAAIAAADFNGDGHADLAVADEGNKTVSIFLGNGDGTFGPRADYATGNSPVWVSAADVNADTVLDLAVANKGDNTVSILLGNGTSTTSTTSGTTSVGNGTFGAQTVYPAGAGPTSIAVADYNLDGLPDLALTDLNDNAVSVLLNLGSGTFGPNFELPVGTSPVSIVTADFNADSRPGRGHREQWLEHGFRRLGFFHLARRIQRVRLPAPSTAEPSRACNTSISA